MSNFREIVLADIQLLHDHARHNPEIGPRRLVASPGRYRSVTADGGGGDSHSLTCATRAHDRAAAGRHTSRNEAINPPCRARPPTSQGGHGARKRALAPLRRVGVRRRCFHDELLVECEIGDGDAFSRRSRARWWKRWTPCDERGRWTHGPRRGRRRRDEILDEGVGGCESARKRTRKPTIVVCECVVGIRGYVGVQRRVGEVAGVCSSSSVEGKDVRVRQEPRRPGPAPNPEDGCPDGVKACRRARTFSPVLGRGRDARPCAKTGDS